jgi:hypothetical protein
MSKITIVEHEEELEEFSQDVLVARLDGHTKDGIFTCG